MCGQDYLTLPNALLLLAVPFGLLSAFATPFELAHELRVARVTCLFVGPELLGLGLAVAREVGIGEERVFVLEGRAEARRSLEDIIQAGKARGVERVRARPVAKDTLAYLMFSSGTTGLPKGWFESKKL